MTLLDFGLALMLIDIGLMIGWTLRDVLQRGIDKNRQRFKD